MRSPLQLTLLAVVGILSALSPAAPAQAADSLTVQVAGGRTYTGFVDSKTDDRQLWLRRELGTGMLRRPISWADRRRVAMADVELGGFPAWLTSRLAVIVLPDAPAAPSPAAAHRPIASLAIDAAVANWDGDVESDGLVVELSVADADGSPTAAAGTLEVELFAPRIRKYHEAPQSRGYVVDLIERWLCRRRQQFAAASPA
jgi:hypothetical protein